ncbi:unnamed protein product [Rotaria sp. Silwood2]|nr:unnamed protein product [Rotaria sp. Silwood2]CAF2781442.1 unnamed protein product [Rotaria sp. Silwood2]CAF4130711.1 unnamed protein product [Rotaria sp. Silwood2]CAF4174004.1 unnamed protein product [Rotaria sp. Silwood2]
MMLDCEQKEGTHECMETLHNNQDVVSTADIHENRHQLQGILAGAVVRPEPLFYRKTRLIIDTHYNREHNILLNGLEEIEFQGIKLISLDKLFDNKHEIFLGFGLPNVYLTVPNQNGDGYVKFAAFMIWRQCSAIIDTKGRVQSGFLIRFRNLPQDALAAIRQAMLKHSNSRHVSCAYANACVLSSAGFTCDGADLNNHFGARSLFQQIFEDGLEYKGEPLTLDFIRTTRLTLEEHFSEVRKKEITSLGRTCRKVINECLPSGSHLRAPLLEAKLTPMKPTVVGDSDSLTRLEISHPGFFGATIRKIIGSHTLFKLIPNKEQVNINNYLPQTLRAFAMKNPSLATRVKKYVLFSRAIVVTIRNQMASCWDDHGYFSPGPLASMMSIHTKTEPHPYNIVITGDFIIGMHNTPGLKLIDWMLSKHVLISGYDDDVRFAGEAWMEHQEDGLVLHLSNNSGTYQPTNDQLETAGKYVSAALPGLKVELHSNTTLSSSPLKPVREEVKFFTVKHILILILACMLALFFLMFGKSKSTL